MVKLTATLIESAASYTNALKDRQLDLRNMQIPVIENLGAARNTHDTIDLTGNDIRILANFPRMTRLHTLLLANNRISKIDPLLSESLPSLETVVLTGNALADLAQLEGFRGCRKLEWLSLVGCPVTRAAGYREWIVWRFPTVRVVDFEHVTEKDRLAARKLYGASQDQPTDAAMAILAAAAAAAGKDDMMHMLTDEERERIKHAIRDASTLEEVRRLEAVLRSGHIPRGMRV